MGKLVIIEDLLWRHTTKKYDATKKIPQKELDGYQCDVALAIGYHHPQEDYNAKLPKSRRNSGSIIVRI